MKFFVNNFRWNRAVKATVLSLLWLAIALAGCTHDTSDLYSPKEWRELFDNAGGWTPLPFPDSKYCPGAIVNIKNGIHYVDNLEACRYPLKEFELKSYVPGINFSKAWEFGASAIINYKGIEAGPEFSSVSKVKMEVIDQGADAFRVLKLRVWLENPENRKKVSQACMEELQKPSTYMITEAFRVSKGKYTLMDKTGATIRLKAGILGKFLKLEPNVSLQITDEGDLVIEQPAYFAIRYAIRVGEGFETPSLGGLGEVPETADAEIEKLFYDAFSK